MRIVQYSKNAQLNQHHNLKMKYSCLVLQRVFCKWQMLREVGSKIQGNRKCWLHLRHHLCLIQLMMMKPVRLIQKVEVTQWTVVRVQVLMKTDADPTRTSLRNQLGQAGLRPSNLSVMPVCINSKLTWLNPQSITQANHHLTSRIIFSNKVMFKPHNTKTPTTIHNPRPRFNSSNNIKASSLFSMFSSYPISIMDSRLV